MENMLQYENTDDPHQQQKLNPWEKMAQEVMANEPSHEVVEKKFYETKVEFSGDDFINFRNELFNATPDEAKRIIESRITLLEESADKVKKISGAAMAQHIHRGYISGDTAVSFGDTIGSQYKLKDTEYLYDAVNYLRNNKERISNGRQFFEQLTGFLNSYFGIPDTSKDRWATIENKTGLQSIQDDNEYWNAIDNIDIGVFKGEHVAQCSERSAMAQNIMSLFGYETYYVNGDVSVDGKKNEGHAYNIVADNGGQKLLVDYSITSAIEHNGTSWDIPTMAIIEDYDSFVAGNNIKTSSWRHTIQNDGNVTHKRGRALVYGIMK